MAKKLSIGKIVLIGVAAVITLGSVSALLHGRDEKEDEHVHDFGTSLVCECGERKQELLVSEVEVGMDLTGYDIQLAVSNNEFLEYITENGGFLPNNCSVVFENTYESAGLDQNYVIDINLTQITVPDATNGPSYIRAMWDSESGYIDMGVASLPYSVGNVKAVNGDEAVMNYFKLVYVDKAIAPASYNLPKREVAKEEQQAEAPALEQETEDFGDVGNEIPDDSELWSRIY